MIPARLPLSLMLRNCVCSSQCRCRQLWAWDPNGIVQSRLPTVRRKSDRFEFSEWLMSATLAERERVLRDLKRKEKVPDG
ncbi:hypothetical protein RHMOL_Rhmol06G0060700 [Rhododendron molle]|uniref:Uncharacterized protein n=1 Tax=Rhododendron molle TaxID=49168 RepID=A0ACC0NBJ9_RHOML|nr:hypothetical protein RHMOL_Rhmol06G0060700 [Rhododendron molle]